MCASVDIKSALIGGYAKGEKDVTDSFYLDEHAWNAASISGQWVLVDNTWDAGYVRLYRKSFETDAICLFDFIEQFRIRIRIRIRIIVQI